jgi:hypothetical protein
LMRASTKLLAHTPLSNCQSMPARKHQRLRFCCRSSNSCSRSTSTAYLLVACLAVKRGSPAAHREGSRQSTTLAYPAAATRCCRAAAAAALQAAGLSHDCAPAQGSAITVQLKGRSSRTASSWAMKQCLLDLEEFSKAAHHRCWLACA